MTEEKILNILNKELEKALGCTEPISIAYATALGRNYLKGKDISHINVYASKNVIKNAMGVTIPGTKYAGIQWAAALGFIIGNHDKKLELLDNLNENHVKNAAKMINQRKISYELADSPKKLYIEIILEDEISKVRVIIENSHTNVSLIESDGNIIKKDNNHLKSDESSNIEYLNLDSIYKFIENVEIKKLGIIIDSIELNLKICIQGLNKQYGLRVGETINSNINTGISGDIASYAVALTAAGSDARMSGSTLPVVSNSGSGNQGISATIPVVVVGELLNAGTEKLLRAITLSHLITIYIKSKFGRLSTICGASVSATGACCGITYLLGGKKEEIESAIQNMLGNVTGILCDGAKPGCAMKIATCTNAAFQSAYMAIKGIKIDSSQGIIEENTEKTIENFCNLGNLGMDKAEDIILNIMLKKQGFLINNS